MELSKRLQALKALATNSPTEVWDIGCDHGLLGLSFLANGCKVHLVDPSERVIEVLEQKLKDSYITIPDKIFIHHKKGQDLSLSQERKSIFIAGMGGKEIVTILAHFENQISKDDIVIISPHRNLLHVRIWLEASSYRLICELVTLDEGLFYPMFALSQNPSFPKVSRYGVGIWEGPVGEEYLRHEERVHSRHQDEASRAYLAFLKNRIPLN